MRSVVTRLGIMAGVALVCASGADKKKNDERFSPGPASSYQTKQTIEGVTVAAVPYNTEELAHTAFGKLDPNKYGILPVLIIIQNDTDKVLNLSAMQTRYQRADDRQIEATAAQELPYTLQKRPKEVPVGIQSPLPRLPGSKKNKNPLAAWEIEGRAFTARMLPAHEAVNGFVYFETVHLEGSRLVLSGLREAATGKELFFFEVPLSR
jgi:hypothetical protein